MTDEFDAGLYLKRARTLETAFGNRAFHKIATQAYGILMFDHSFDELLKQRPELQEKYGAFLEAVNENGRIPHAVLAACQSRVRQVHGLEADNEQKPSSEAERFALVVAEKMPSPRFER